MRVASWNVNSVRARLPRIEPWLREWRPDLLCMQEIKVVDGDFPREPFVQAGYHLEIFGQKTYNGVAVISRTQATDPITEFPGFDDPQRRVLAATISGIRIVDLYVPNGQAVGAEKYEYKLSWLAALRDFLQGELSRHEKLVVLGDFNIAPADEDVHDAEKWGEAILCSPLERKAFRELLDLGLSDVFRKFDQPEKAFSWWDYRAAGFRRNAGLRIDLILTSDAMTKRCSASYIDKEPRAWERPSDHAPVVAEFEF